MKVDREVRVRKERHGYKRGTKIADLRAGLTLTGGATNVTKIKEKKDIKKCEADSVDVNHEICKCGKNGAKRGRLGETEINMVPVGNVPR